MNPYQATLKSILLSKSDENDLANNGFAFNDVSVSAAGCLVQFEVVHLWCWPGHTDRGTQATKKQLA